MRIDRTRGFGIAALGVALMAQLPAAPALAYTVLTLDGKRIEAVEKPEVIGLQARLRLASNGLLVVIQEEKIDWKRTTELNAGDESQRRPLVVPADTTLAEGQSGQAAPPAPPIEIKIQGGPVAQAPAPAPSQTPVPEPTTPIAQAPETLEELARLNEELGQIVSILQAAEAQKKSIDEEVSRIKNRPEAPATLSSEDIARLRELEKKLDQTREGIRAAQERLQQIKERVNQLQPAQPAPAPN
jgi:hypothetical protein